MRCPLRFPESNIAGNVPAAGIGEYYSASHLSAGGGPLSPKQAEEQERFQSFCDRVFAGEMEAAPTLDLHYTLLHPETFGIVPKDISLGSFSLEAMITENRERRSLRDELLQFDRSLLSGDWQILYDTLLETLDTALLGEGLELYEQPLAPTIGVQAQLPILLSEYSFQTVGDVETYLALLEQIDGYYGQILEFENRKAEAGLAPSDASIDAIIKSCESYRIDPEHNFLTETFDSRLNTLNRLISEAGEAEPLSDERLAGFRNRHTEIIRDHFIPAYENLIAGISALKGRGIHDGGLCALAEGKDYYRYLLKLGPGLSYTPEELKEALLRQADEDLEAIGRLYRENPDACTENAAFALSDPAEILNDLRQKMKADFPECPDCGYEIRYVPEYLESSLSPAFYLTAPVDGLDQNVIYINRGSRDGTENLYTTLAHEGFPGHLYQTVYSRAHAIHPLAAVLSCSGANEGWATYVENYACRFDNGLSPGAGEYRARSRSFSLCIHGLLDLGINYEGWTKDQAKRFITSYFQAGDSLIDELWQTMIDNPANYLEYCGGYVEFAQMRREAEETLGDRFSPMEFHRLILDTGPVPFSVMRRRFAEWLAGVSGQIR